MSRGRSGRIVLEVDPTLKNELHAAVALEGRTLKDWFLETVAVYLRVGAANGLGSRTSVRSVKTRREGKRHGSA